MRRYNKQMTELILLGLLAGCSYTGLMKPWIGESADSLVARWGAPASTTTLPDGRSVIEYHDSVSPGVSGFPARGPSGFTYGPYTGATSSAPKGFPSEATFGRSDPQSFVARSLEDSARAVAFAEASMQSAMKASAQAHDDLRQNSFPPGGFAPAKGKLPCTTRFTIDASHTITNVVAEGGGCNQGWYLERMYFTKHRVKKTPPKASAVTTVPEAAKAPAGPSG